VGDPALLVLDEPTRSLDADARGRFWAAVARRSQLAAVIATHLDEDVMRATSVVDLEQRSECGTSAGDYETSTTLADDA
jgi:ABC-type multidrug transport system ATPase subunit